MHPREIEAVKFGNKIDITLERWCADSEHLGVQREKELGEALADAVAKALNNPDTTNTVTVQTGGEWAMCCTVLQLMEESGIIKNVSCDLGDAEWETMPNRPGQQPPFKKASGIVVRLEVR